MSARVLLSHNLADLCEDVCSQCSSEQSGLILTDGSVKKAAPPMPIGGADTAANGPISEIRRHVVSLPKQGCSRCNFILLLQAIDHLVSAEDIADWLKQPNIDLDGRSPAECIEAREYAPVFQALFLIETTQPALSS